MKIEDEIKQVKFASEYVKTHINILYTANWFRNKTQEVLKPFGITHQQFNVLKILKGKQGQSCTAQEVKDVMIDKGPDLTRLVDRMILKELVLRKECCENRRKLDLTITEKGLILVDKIVPKLGKVHFSNKNITPEEAQTLSDLLDKLRG